MGSMTSPSRTVTESKVGLRGVRKEKGKVTRRRYINEKMNKKRKAMRIVAPPNQPIVVGAGEGLVVTG